MKAANFRSCRVHAINDHHWSYLGPVDDGAAVDAEHGELIDDVPVDGGDGPLEPVVDQADTGNDDHADKEKEEGC